MRVRKHLKVNCKRTELGAVVRFRDESKSNKKNKTKKNNQKQVEECEKIENVQQNCFGISITYYLYYSIFMSHVLSTISRFTPLVSS